jgi:FkbM family methyltransferase
MPQFFKKFSLNYLHYRLHQFFYFKKIIVRDNFKLIIDKKRVPLYNLKGLLIKYHNHEKDERALIQKFIEYENTLELGCSIGILSLYIKKKIKDKKLISIDANLQAINYCKDLFKLNSLKNYKFIHHKIGGGNFLINKKNFLSSQSSLIKTDNKYSKKFLNDIIFHNKIKNLIIDIEGMEQFLFNFLDLSQIKLIFIELHPNIYGLKKTKEIIKELNSKKFKIISNLNNNYCFKNKLL